MAPTQVEADVIQNLILHLDNYQRQRGSTANTRFVTDIAVSYTHLRAHETPEHLVCRLLLEKKKKNFSFFFLMIRRPPRSTLDRSSAASDVYKRQIITKGNEDLPRIQDSLPI